MGAGGKGKGTLPKGKGKLPNGMLVNSDGMNIDETWNALRRRNAGLASLNIEAGRHPL